MIKFQKVMILYKVTILIKEKILYQHFIYIGYMIILASIIKFIYKLYINFVYNNIIYIQRFNPS